jgi:hypothetical protein
MLTKQTGPSVVVATTASNLLVSNTITAQTLIVSTISSSVEYSSGSNIFGSSLSNTQQLTGSVSITGSLTTFGNSTISGSLNVQRGITGSLLGSASYAITSSNAFTNLAKASLAGCGAFC